LEAKEYIKEKKREALFGGPKNYIYCAKLIRLAGRVHTRKKKTDKGKRRVHMEMERREKVYLSIIFPGRMLRIGFISAYHPMHVTLTGATLWTIWSLEPRSEGKQQLSCPNAIATVQ